MASHEDYYKQGERVQRDIDTNDDRLRPVESRAAADDDSLFVLGAGPRRFPFCVVAMTNMGWPLASLLPQIAVCGFFSTQAEAQAYQERHQKYKTKDGNPHYPDGPVFVTVETQRLYPIAYSMRRAFGDQNPALYKKQKAIVKSYYRMRDFSRKEVQGRMAREMKGEVSSTTAATDANVDPRVKRNAVRRARRQAYELISRLEAQVVKVRRLRQMKAEGDDVDKKNEDDEMADFLDSLSPEHRAMYDQMRLEEAEKERQAKAPPKVEPRRRKKAPRKRPPAAGAGAGSGSTEDDDGNGDGDAEGAGGDVEPETDTAAPGSNVRLGEIEEYIAWVKADFARRGIKPASDEMMDDEEREFERSELSKQAQGEVSRILDPERDVTLPPPPHPDQQFYIGLVIYDRVADRLSADEPKAAKREHMFALFDTVPNADAAKARLRDQYSRSFTEEDLFFARVGKWCCFDKVSEDDGETLYRQGEETVHEIMKGEMMNHGLEFVEESLKHKADKLPLPNVA